MYCVCNLQIIQLSQGGKEFYVTRDGTQIIRVMRNRAQISRGRRDLAQQRDAWFTIFITRDAWVFPFEISVMINII